jgi:hypothetical protein
MAQEDVQSKHDPDKLAEYLSETFTKAQLIDLVVDSVLAQEAMTFDTTSFVADEFTPGPGRPTRAAQQLRYHKLTEYLRTIYPASVTLPEIANAVGTTPGVLENWQDKDTIWVELPPYLAAYFKQADYTRRPRVLPLWRAIFDLHFLHLLWANNFPKLPLDSTHIVLHLPVGGVSMKPGDIATRNYNARRRATAIYHNAQLYDVAICGADFDLTPRDSSPELQFPCPEFCNVSHAYTHNRTDGRYQRIKNIRDLLHVEGLADLPFVYTPNEYITRGSTVEVARQIMGLAEMEHNPYDNE